MNSITAAASMQICLGICDPQSCPTLSCRLLSKQTSFLVYCEQIVDDFCANGLQAMARRLMSEFPPKRKSVGRFMRHGLDRRRVDRVHACSADDNSVCQVYLARTSTATSTHPNHPFNRARYVVRACDAPAHPPLQPLSFCRTSRTLPLLFPTPTEPAISSPILRMKENMASALFGKS